MALLLGVKSTLLWPVMCLSPAMTYQHGGIQLRMTGCPVARHDTNYLHDEQMCEEVGQKTSTDMSCTSLWVSTEINSNPHCLHLCIYKVLLGTFVMGVK